MTNRRERAILRRLRGIDRKCDMILAALRTERKAGSPVDEAIDRLHEAARCLREQSAREREYFQGL